MFVRPVERSPSHPVNQRESHRNTDTTSDGIFREPFALALHGFHAKVANLVDQLYHGLNWYIETPAPMEITIDIDNPLPQFEQLIEQIKAAVTAGVLKPGDSLPSIRQLANDLELNSKTVAKAYQLLTRDSVIETKGYRGTYVHPKAKANCKFNLQQWTLRKLSESIAELREAGVTDSEIRNAFAGAISRQLSTK